MAVLLLLSFLFWTLLAIAALVLFNIGLCRLIEALAPPKGQFIDIGGLRLHVIDSGDKPGLSPPPILFIHGLLGQLNNFTYALAGRFPERRIVLIDRPGSGYSQAAPSQSLKAQGDLVAKIIDKMNLRQPLVVGHSLGGAVALALALDHPAKVGGLALIAPLTHSISAPPKPFGALAFRSPLALWLGAWTLGPLATLLSFNTARKEVFGPEPMARDYWRRGGAILSARPPALIAAARDIAHQPEELPPMAARYASLALPIGVLFGAQDHLLDPKAQGEDFCAKNPNTQLTLIDGGHMLPVTQPRAAEDLIRATLLRL
ncbi:alpha/beta hydrolase [uncultured Rhodoblastus sp.]|uniref:alpha/beta fold hydrolase n=1 Tax=uncultured Rhodoblastus sp. TaxID=543037 RepID=UPI0025DCA850|nr:alpha/beta hydrolase [uncultured Rhodoblastus sp.]